MSDLSLETDPTHDHARELNEEWASVEPPAKWPPAKRTFQFEKEPFSEVQSEDARWSRARDVSDCGAASGGMKAVTRPPMQNSVIVGSAD